MTSDHMSPPPVLSVVMPVFNAGKHLRASLQSILNQSFTDWELILIDDGSTDDAVDEASDLFDARVRLIRDGANTGLATRLNQAIELARGMFIARMDGDDIAHPERFARQLEVLLDKPELDLVGTRCVVVSERGELLGELPSHLEHADLCARPWLGFYLPHPTWMGKAQWFRNNRYSVPAPFRCEDQELLLRTCSSSRFRVVDAALLAYRVRDTTKFSILLKTRLALCRVQSRFFFDSGRYHYALASVIAAFFRLTADLLRHVKFYGDSRYRKGSPSEPTHQEWKHILHGFEH